MAISVSETTCPAASSTRTWNPSMSAQSASSSSHSRLQPPCLA